jgi:PPOX class probable F420-dependent enzyme
MDFEDVRPFMEKNHWGVITTYQPDGAMHTSIVVCGVFRDSAAFVIVRSKSAKTRNLRRDPRCTVLAVSNDWRSYAVVEGQAELLDYRNTPAEEYRVLLRDVFRACGDKEHPDWEEYDQAMVEQDAVTVFVKPDRVYGMLR